MLSLVAAAETALDKERYDQAALNIERAINIETGNARLWSLLGDIRLRQGETLQAIQVLQKSDSLAPGNRRLHCDNQKLLIEAYQQSGNLEAAYQLRAQLSCS